MDESRINAASLGLKHCQQLLGRLLEGGVPQALHGEIAAAITDLVDAQDAFIVLRESMQALEFNNAALHEQVLQARTRLFPPVGTQVGLRQESPQ